MTTDWAVAAGTIPSMKALRKIIVAMPYHPAQAELWLKALLPTPDVHGLSVCPCPELTEVVICQECGPLETKILEALLDLVGRRREQGHPVKVVQLWVHITEIVPTGHHIDRYEDLPGGSGRPPVPLLREIHSQLVEGIRFSAGNKLPTMQAPEVVATQSNGEWKWPLWPEEFLTCVIYQVVPALCYTCLT